MKDSKKNSDSKELNIRITDDGHVIEEDDEITDEEAKEIAEEIIFDCCKDPQNPTMAELARAIQRIKQRFGDQDVGFTVVEGADGTSFAVDELDVGIIN